MLDSRLDQIVKGSPSPSIKLPSIAPLQNISSVSSTSTENTTTPSQQISDPLSSLPSSPPQIYLNLLILESSLRAQYLQLLSRRRLHTFFVLLLSLWTGTFTYLLFLRPREDGLALGGSVYWVVETTEKVALMGGAVTIILFWGTGQWERGIRWPRRWVGITNRGLRGFNLRVVVLRGPWWREWPRHLAFLFPMMNLQTSGSEWHLVEYSPNQHGGRLQQPHHHHPDEETGTSLPSASTATTTTTTTTSQPATHNLIEEDLAPGGDYIHLLLLPKHFSPEFRENWHDYRSDYWERENERRATLRTRCKQQRRARAKQHGGWLWWTGLWRTTATTTSPSPSSTSSITKRHSHHSFPRRSGDLDTTKPSSTTNTTTATHPHRRPIPVFDKDDTLTTTTTKPTLGSRRRSTLRSDSQHSSRSTTPALDVGGGGGGGGLGLGFGLGSEERPISERIRRGSSAASTRRKAKERGGGAGVGPGPGPAALGSISALTQGGGG
jgi:Spo7-like protein